MMRHFGNGRYMGKQKATELQLDVEALLQDSTAAQASEKVWEKFEQALLKLDGESMGLLCQHFKGVSFADLGRQNQMSESQIRMLITQKKQELVQLLKTGNSSRQ